jgi:hypothetical protein
MLAIKSLSLIVKDLFGALEVSKNSCFQSFALSLISSFSTQNQKVFSFSHLSSFRHADAHRKDPI